MRDFKAYIDKLDVEKICLFLNRHGWREIGSLKSGRIKQFEKDSVDDAILVPFSKKFSDYYNVFTDSLQVLSNSESSTLISLLNKLINPSCDLLKWRIADSDTFMGSIPFDTMGNNIDHIKDLLAVSCLDILKPSTFHKKVLTNEVVTQIKQYKFGQTEIGSYILSILSPLGTYQYDIFNPIVEELPLTRRINLRLLDNIDKIQNSVEKNSSELIDCIQSQEISVNFLTALSDLYIENRDAQVSISANWNSDVPNSSDISVVTDVTLTPRCIDKVMEVAEANTPQEQQNVEKTFYGKITNIGGAAELDNRSTIKIKIACIGDEGRKITVQAEMPYSTYDIAEDAFENADTVKVTGILSKAGYINRLSHASIEKI